MSYDHAVCTSTKSRNHINLKYLGSGPGPVGPGPFKRSWAQSRLGPWPIWVQGLVGLSAFLGRARLASPTWAQRMWARLVVDLCSVRVVAASLKRTMGRHCFLRPAPRVAPASGSCQRDQREGSTGSRRLAFRIQHHLGVLAGQTETRRTLSSELCT